jgi:hypothetical protein
LVVLAVYHLCRCEWHVTMDAAEKLQELVRKLPGVAGYQDREGARDTDHAVRMRLTTELNRLRRMLDAVTRRQAEQRAFAILPTLDRLSVRMEKIANMMRFAGRGYQGLFERKRVDLDSLQRLCAFDLALLGQLDGVRDGVAALAPAEADPPTLERVVQDLNTMLDRLEETFLERDRVLKEGT